MLCSITTKIILFSYVDYTVNGIKKITTFQKKRTYLVYLEWTIISVRCYWGLTAYLKEDQRMYHITEVDGFIHLLPEGKRRPPFPYNRCAGPSEPSKQEIHTTRNETGEGGGC